MSDHSFRCLWQSFCSLFLFRPGPTAPSQLKVLRKDDGYLKTLKANKGRHSKGQKNKRKQVKQAGGVQPPTSGQ